MVVVLAVVVPVGVYLTNTELFIDGFVFVQGLSIYDVFSMTMSTVTMLLPFLLARRYLNTPEAAASLLRALVIGGLAYSMLCLIEIRLSPQLHNWIYGFFTHSFLQHIRGGGYRPMVFIEHGLRVGIFMAIALLAAIALYKETRASNVSKHKSSKGLPYGLIALWLFVILFLVKSLGAMLIALILIPLLLFTRPRLQMLAAAALAGMVILYPMLRSSGVVPTDFIYETAAAFDVDRANSFKGRLDNEDILLDKAAAKPVFGWGGWGRSRVYDAGSGKDISTTDGTWVIIFGSQGWIGYIATFSLLCVPLWHWCDGVRQARQIM